MNLPALIRSTTVAERKTTEENAAWLQQHMSPYFFQAMEDEKNALVSLTREMARLRSSRRLILADRDKLLIQACINKAGSLYETLRQVGEREISYAMFSHSNAPMPGMTEELEVQRFEFDLCQDHEIDLNQPISIPQTLVRKIRAELRTAFPEFDLRKLDRLLKILWLNDENYIRMSPPSRVAYLVWLFDRGNSSGGLFVDISEVVREGRLETRVLFAVGNPPQEEFLLQLLEIFNRLDIGIRRAYCQTISNGTHPYFLGAFYVQSHRDEALLPGSPLAELLKRELCTTQILATSSQVYRDIVTEGLMSGEDASLVNAFIAFCHTSLAHGQPERFGLEDVRKAFYDHPEMAQLLIKFFRTRFDPELADQEETYSALLIKTLEAVEGYNTGHRWLDEIRRAVYRCCLLLIMHTLKTNFFVVEKQALAFRLDPAYLRDMGDEFTADLPETLPFRVTFFFSRAGYGYHIGFSDIARGGWRTVIARSSDDFITASNTLFREVYVLAHTQHLKNKDIYEGGSKLVLLLDASDLQRSGERELENWRLYKLQYGVTNAFLDIFVTENGVAKLPAVVDYYREDEPIELGPDENMHDSMIENIARLSKRRGYLLGIGIMSSKEVGINHKEYGVTSTGVVRFAEITMAELGVDMRRDPFSVKFTGGPNGDVAGNAMRIMLERYPAMQIRLILDGSAALCDPLGADHAELSRILLKEDLDGFDPQALNPGGFMLFRSGSRTEGLRTLYRRVAMGEEGLSEEWVSIDDFSREYGELIFTTPADLFIPGGGRPETIDVGNWERFFLADGTPSARAIIEGANSFITPEARVRLQRRGVIIMRDASANKCGVISSSYEIIANLLMADGEFLADKERYVGDVLEILEKRAGDEARLILKRRRDNPALLCTEISDAISTEINGHYSRLFRFFQGRPELLRQPLFRRVILAHLPKVVADEPRYKRRVAGLPQKYLCAILAAELGSSMVCADRETEYEDILRLHIARNFAAV